MELQRVWEIELKILDHIDRFCKDNKLKYSLAYGTLLGAVRHGGFIPWDDDVDIIMPRYDYELLVSSWNIPGYILQNKRTNGDFDQNFTKIRKDHTTFIQFEFEKQVSYHTGIFVDIFPADRVAPNALARKAQYIYGAMNLLYTREHISGEKSSIIERVLLAVPHNTRLKIQKQFENKLQKWNNIETEFMNASTLRELCVYFPSDLFDEMIDIEFEGKKYMCTRKYDAFLKSYYGDYMQLPPEEERVLMHHPLVVDFDHNYTENM